MSLEMSRPGPSADAGERVVTECVTVPSPEHVAAIHGQNGRDIKEIRVKTNTYIETPKRTEEPVFQVTGLAQDVTRAKNEILLRSMIYTWKLAWETGIPPNEHVRELVRVPSELVKYVVGTNGATIQRIQSLTNTVILTTLRNGKYYFLVSGLPASVRWVRWKIRELLANAMRREPCLAHCTNSPI